MHNVIGSIGIASYYVGLSCQSKAKMRMTYRIAEPKYIIHVCEMRIP